MKVLFKLFILLLVFSIASCASTKGNFVTEQQDAWMDGIERGLLYCRANVKNDGLANPVCYEARFEEYKDEKKRVEKRKRKERKRKEKEEGY